MDNIKEINEWVKIILNEERNKNENDAWIIAREIMNKIDLTEYDNLDTWVTVFIRVRKWKDINSTWWWHMIATTNYTRAIDLYQAKLSFDKIINKYIWWE